MRINILDIIFGFLLLSFSITVYRRGFIKELFSKLAWVGAAIIAFIFAPVFGYTLVKEITGLINEPLLYIIAFIFLFSFSFVLIKWIGSFVGTVFKLPVLNNLNKILGFFLGLIEASIIIAIVIEFLLLQSYIPRSTWIGNSKIIPFFITYVLRIAFY